MGGKDLLRNWSLRYRSFGPPLQHLVLENSSLGPRPYNLLRVAMSLVPVNPSDLIPVTGAYSHRIRLPATAGYEGVGRVIEAPPGNIRLSGRRVLPLRGAGTWQCFVDCDPAFAVTIPDDVSDETAARSYINPLTALRLLERWQVKGKSVLLTAGGSACATLLGFWAMQRGAEQVTGIYRSPNRVRRMRHLGIIPLTIDDERAIRDAAAEADLTFDALGGPVASSLLASMTSGSEFISYGLLSGKPISFLHPPRARYARFHLRDELPKLTPQDWQRQFELLWPLIRGAGLPEVRVFSLSDWAQAVRHSSVPGTQKALIDFVGSHRDEVLSRCTTVCPGPYKPSPVPSK